MKYRKSRVIAISGGILCFVGIMASGINKESAAEAVTVFQLFGFAALFAGMVLTALGIYLD